MNQLEIQRIVESEGQPDAASFQQWADITLANLGEDTEMVIRIVGTEESAGLNENYRHKQGPTNILSFPFEAPEIEGFQSNLLGDLVICAPVLATEAQQQNKPLLDHWAHIVIHGILHLLGYDHINDDEAEEMENKEIAILQKLNIPNPYLQVIDHER
ncbi:MAG: rRNA maturation RNase YbeY [Methylobacter sp.]|nr:MAG: rRNA maturation RNase YbeY [Methylobacter sp.]